MDIEAQKRAAAARAVEFVRPGMRLGLGTGSTAKHFVELLGERVRAGLDVVGVPTSEATGALAQKVGIRLTTLDQTTELDLTVDGADEIGPDLTLIKGGGGALLREKIVASASARMLVISDKSKCVSQLGRFPLPVEIVPFGAQVTRRAVEAASCCSRLPGRGNDTQRAKRPCFRHGWRSLGSGRPIAAHSRPASSRGPAGCDPRSYGTRFVHRPCLDCYCGRSGRGAAYRAALISSTKGSAPMFAGLSKRHVMAALVAFATIAAAGSASAQGQPSPNAILLAKQIVQLKGVGNVMDPIARGVVEKVKSPVMQTNFMFQKDINESPCNCTRSSMARSSELVDQTAQLYASRFTEPELKQILTFYQSPLGKKMIAEEPKIHRRQHETDTGLGG